MKSNALALLAIGAAAHLEVQSPEAAPQIASGKPALVTRHAKRLRQPLVEDKNCSRLCVFENDDNSWCFSTTPPILKVGWTWNNSFGESEDPYDTNYTPVKYYRWSLEPYL